MESRITVSFLLNAFFKDGQRGMKTCVPHSSAPMTAHEMCPGFAVGRSAASQKHAGALLSSRPRTANIFAILVSCYSVFS